MNKVEQWKAEKHGLDVWPDIERYAAERTPMKQIDPADLERMKWHGVFYRKRDTPESYMIRIRIPGCELSAQQAKEIAYIAYEFGHGIVDVTTRANIQVQGLAIQHVPQAISRLERCGLTARQTGHDNIRNVFCHPRSGVDPEELIDTRQLCRDVTALFVDSRVYSDLPRKFNIAISGREPNGLHYWTQDISYLATRGPDDDVMFQVLVGGTQGQNPHLPWHLPVLVMPEQVVDVTRAILDLFRAQGSREKRDRARFRFLIEQIGVEGVLAWLDQQLPYPLVPHANEPQPSGRYDELIGWFPEKAPRRWTMGLCVPLGRLSWMQLEGLARLATRWGDGTLRTTHEQGMMLTGVATGFKEAAATDAAALRLSPEADTLARNTVACTGKQFCNIAVTETKGQMLRLIERLRQRALTLHGIRIHMSGCPSSCAQHFTADIGLKGVRVRRLLGTREGFDVYLGGGIAGRMHLAQLYRQGVDADQLPQLIEEVVAEYYLKHKPGQTFSSYWREVLAHREASKVADEDFLPPVWLCEGCGYEHRAEDPPVFCPGCAGLRRLFARVETPADGASAQADPASRKAAATPKVANPGAAPTASATAPKRHEDYVLAARVSDVPEGEGLAVEVEGHELALYRTGEEIVALDALCPHEGAALVDGSFDGRTITCPWHGWTFDACSGCSHEPPGHQLRRYATRLIDGKVFVRLAGSEDAGSGDGRAGGASGDAPALPKSTTAVLPLLEIIDESPDTKTFRFDNSSGQVPPHLPGQFMQICHQAEGQTTWRSFTISSSPTDASRLDLTVKRNPHGTVSNWLHTQATVGQTFTLRGPLGRFFFDPQRHRERLVLISAGSGITPMISIARYLAATNLEIPCTFLYGARTEDDILFRAECESCARSLPAFRYHVRLSRPGAAWPGDRGRIDFDWVRDLVPDLAEKRYFLCGPGDFIAHLLAALAAAGVPEERLHQEAFGSPTPAATS